ncbi:16811_t:CDS:2, partial [Racocetra persica]
EYTIDQFVEFIYTNSKNQHEKRFRRIEAIISFLLPSNFEYPNNQIQDDDREFYSYIKIHIGDVVTIKEENDEFYAIVKAIFTHKYNDGHVYAFVWIDWLKNTKHTDSLLRCPIFKKQTDSDTK